jgi:hypothetical protein
MTITAASRTWLTSAPTRPRGGLAQAVGEDQDLGRTGNAARNSSAGRGRVDVLAQHPAQLGPARLGAAVRTEVGAGTEVTSSCVAPSAAAPVGPAGPPPPAPLWRAARR